MADPVCDQLVGSIQIVNEKQESLVGTFNIFRVYGKFVVRISAVDSDVYSTLRTFGLSEGQS